MDDNKTWRDTFLRIVALLGLILVLLLGAWGIILLAFNLPSIASSIGTSITSFVTGTASPSSDEESLAVTAPNTVTSGQALVLSWVHTNGEGEHNYTVSYECATGLSVKAPTPAGQYQSVACNTPFNYVGASESMALIPTISGKTSVEATFVVSAVALEDGAITASTATDVSINPVVATTPTGTTPTTGTPQGTYVPATRATNLYGYPDLAVRVLSANALSYSQGRSTVQFEVANVGSNVARAGWNFDASLPVVPAYVYRAPTQQALYPGDKIIYTLTFDNGRYNTNYNDDRYDDEKYDECDESQNSWDAEEWFDWYQDTWDTNSDSREDWSESKWEDWYEDFCDDYEDSRDNRSTSTRNMTIIVDPSNYISEYNESNNRASVSVY